MVCTRALIRRFTLAPLLILAFMNFSCLRGIWQTLSRSRSRTRPRINFKKSNSSFYKLKFNFWYTNQRPIKLISCVDILLFCELNKNSRDIMHVVSISTDGPDWPNTHAHKGGGTTVVDQHLVTLPFILCCFELLQLVTLLYFCPHFYIFWICL